MEPIQKSWLSRNWTYIGIFIILILYLNQCSSNCDLELANKNLESRKKTSDSIIGVKVADNAIKDGLISGFKSGIDSLQSIIKNKESKVVIVQKTATEKLDQVKSYDTHTFKQYFSERYGLPNEMSISDSGLSIKDTVSTLIVSDLIKGDSVKEELDLTYSIIFDERQKSSIKDSIISVQEIQKSNFKSIVSEKDGVILIQDQIVKNQQSIIKKKTNNSILLKIAIPVSFVLGCLIAK